MYKYYLLSSNMNIIVTPRSSRENFTKSKPATENTATKLNRVENQYLDRKAVILHATVVTMDGEINFIYLILTL